MKLNQMFTVSLSALVKYVIAVKMKFRNLCWTLWLANEENCPPEMWQR